MTAGESTAQYFVQDYPIAADRETDVAVLTDTTGLVMKLAVAFDIIESVESDYARRLAETLPGAKMWTCVDREQVRTLHVAVAAGDWSPEKEEAAYGLLTEVYTDLPDPSAVYLDLDVRFADDPEPSLIGYRPVL